jgi:hypothetical protein
MKIIKKIPETNCPRTNVQVVEPFCVGGFLFMEIWKDIKDYEGHYQVSNLGNIKSLQRVDSIGRNVNEKVLKFKINRYGYYNVELYNRGKSKTLKVHRLVANAFLEKDNKRLEVNHIDGDKSNNSVNNLEWCNRSENIRHSYLNCLRFSKKKGNHSLSKLVLNTQTGIYYECVKDAAIAANVEYDTLRAIYRVCG